MNQKLQTITNQNTSENFEEYIKEAESYLQQQDVEKAIACYQKILQTQPLTTNLAQIYIHSILKLGLQIENVEIFDQFIHLYPELSSQISSIIEHNCQLTNIYHCCVPKTASTWLKRIFTDARVYKYSGLFPFQAEFISKSKNIPTNTIVTGTFTPKYEEFIQKIESQDYRAFFVMRDPRDIVISAYFSNRYSHKLMDHISQTRQILEGLSVEEGIIYTIETLRDVFAILRSWVYGAKDNPNVLLFGYENITGESAFQSFKRLYDHCNITISDALISQILDDYSFEKLSQGRKQGSEDQSSHYRKGLPGDWKNYFNSTIRSKFEEIAEDLVGDLGYEWDGLGVLGQPYQGIYGDFQEPVSHTSVQVSVENKVEQTLHAASETYQAGLLDVSLKQYQSVMEMLEPYLAPTYFYLGRIHHQKEQFELAVEAYKKAILINSELVDSYFFIAQILAKQGQAEQAIEYYQKFIDRKSDVPDVYFHLAILHYKQEQLDEAKKNFKTFLKLRPNAADAHFYLGGVYFKQGELERAMSCYRKSLENNPNLADSYFYMAEIHLKRGQVKRSMQLHNKYKAMKKLHS